MQTQEFTDAQWGLTPDVLLFAAAAVLTLGVVIFSLVLFARAAREEKHANQQQGKPPGKHEGPRS